MSEESLYWHNVKSSFVEAVAYDAEEHDLYVTLSHGSYVYKGVPQHVFRSFLNSDSKGTFFNTKVKDVYAFFQR